MRMAFTQVFTILPDGSFSPVAKTQIRGFNLKPGMWIGEGVTIPGLDLQVLRGRDLEVEVLQGVSVVKAAY
jgi:hypothetical protein